MKIDSMARTIKGEREKRKEAKRKAAEMKAKIAKMNPPYRPAARMSAPPAGCGVRMIDSQDMHDEDKKLPSVSPDTKKTPPSIRNSESKEDDSASDDEDEEGDDGFPFLKVPYKHTLEGILSQGGTDYAANLPFNGVLQVALKRSVDSIYAAECDKHEPSETYWRRISKPAQPSSNRPSTTAPISSGSGKDVLQYKVQRMRHDLSEAENCLTNMAADVESLRRDFADLKRRNDDLERNFDSRVRQEVQREINRLVSIHSDYAGTFPQFLSRVNNVYSDIDTLWDYTREQVPTLHERVDSVEKRCDSVGERVQLVEENVDVTDRNLALGLVRLQKLDGGPTRKRRRKVAWTSP